MIQIVHSISADETSQKMRVDFHIDTPMGPLRFEPIFLSPEYHPPAEQAAKILQEIARIRSRLTAYMEMSA